MAKRRTQRFRRGGLRSVQHVIQIGDGAMMCHGVEPMFIPEGGPHVRQVFLKLPPFSKRPTAAVTIHSDTDPGNVFGVFNITFDRNVPHFQWCKITAQTAHNSTTSKYVCDYIFVGIPRIGTRKRRK